MAFSVKVGSFNVTTAAAGNTVVVSDVGFQPKAIIFFWTGQTAAVDTFSGGDVINGIGVCTGTTNRWAVGGQSESVSSSSDCDRVYREDALIVTLTIAGAVDGLMDLQSFDADGFTLVIDDAFAVDNRIGYIALGGSDLTDATTNRFQAATGVGSQDITTAGFQPDFVLMVGIGTSTAPPTAGTHNIFHVGMATGPSNEGVLAAADDHAQAVMITDTYHRGSEIIAIFDVTNAMNKRAEFTQFLSNGFRLNYLETTDATGLQIMYLALKGGSYQVGDYVTSITNGATITEAGLPFQPKGVFQFSAGKVESASDAPDPDFQLNMGAFTSTTERHAQSCHNEDTSLASDTERAIEFDACLVNISDLLPSTGGHVDVQSINSDGFTLVMDSADFVASYVTYVAFGDAAAGTQTLNGVLFTKAPTFNTGTVSTTYALPGTLFAKAPTFNTGAITATYTLTGALFTKAPTFNTGVVTATYTLPGALFTKAPTFPQGAVTLVGGTQTLDGVLFTKAPTFNVGTVAATYALTGSLFTKTPTFPTGAVTATYALTGTLFTKTPTFNVGVVSASYTLTGTLFSKSPTFPLGAVFPDQAVTGVLFIKAPTFPQGVITSEGGPQVLSGVLFSKAPTFNVGTITPGVRTLTGTLFTKTPTFPQGTVTARFTLSGTLFTKAPSFFVGTLTVAQTLTGVLFQKAPTFPLGVISGAGVGQTLNGVLFVEAPTFFAGAMAYVGGSFWRVNPVAYTLNPAAYDPVERDEVPPWAIEVDGELFVEAPSFKVGAMS